MGLDDIVNSAKTEWNEFISRNNNGFFILGGAAMGVLDGLRMYGPPDPAAAFFNSAFWFWAFWPTVFGVYKTGGLPSGATAKYLYLQMGPENTAAFTVPYLATATIMYGLKAGF